MAISFALPAAMPVLPTPLSSEAMMPAACVPRSTPRPFDGSPEPSPTLNPCTSSTTPLPSLSMPSPAISPLLVQRLSSRSVCFTSTPPSRTTTMGSPFGGGGGGGGSPFVVTARPQLFSVPVSPPALSVTSSFHCPVPFSPLNCARSKVPLRSSAEPPWRSEMTAVFPEGLVSLTVRSPRYVWAMSRFSFNCSMSPPSGTSIVEATVLLSSIFAFGVAVFSNVVPSTGGGGGGGGCAGVPVTLSVQPFSVPTFFFAVSSTMSVHSPFEDSPLNADRSNLPWTLSALPPVLSWMIAVFPEGLRSETTSWPFALCRTFRST